MSHSDSEKKTVLLVEDSPDALEHSKAVLEEMGLNVITAINGIEGLKKMQENPQIPLIVTDYEMPFLNGQEFAQKVRAELKNETVHIIFLSSMTDLTRMKASFESARGDSKVGWIIKPIQREQAEGPIKRLVGIQ